MNEPFPFEDLMALCMGRLGMSSEDFWALTPKEASLIVRGYTGRGAGSTSALTRGDLDALMARYDRK